MSTYDTKPTIENVLERIDALREDMLTGFREVFRRLDLIDAKIDTMNERLLTQEAKLRLHDKRISELEHHPV